ncbi:MAG TPA: hypothetical protein VEJ68_02375 [Candidatus Bathyarchaeia archaeon]|nr:hypothetical protein [Candidatus Bathyarchaeia archaeon]
MHTFEAIMMTVMAVAMFTMALSMLVIHFYWALFLLVSTVAMSVVGVGYFSWKTAKCMCGTGCEHCNRDKNNDSCHE